LPTRKRKQNDSSRIVRADYASPPYSALAAAALARWRTGDYGPYRETGLVLVAGSPEHAYLRASFDNVTAGDTDKAETSTGAAADLRRPVSEEAPSVRWLASPADVALASGTAQAAAAAGYLNPHAGWADAGRALRLLRDRVQAQPRVRFACARADRLIFDARGERVEGVMLASRRNGADDDDEEEEEQEEPLRADLTVLAAGAATPRLLPRGAGAGRLRATLHPVAYVALRRDEAARLSALPSVLDLESGLFIMPPRSPTDGEEEEEDEGQPQFLLKVARHGAGYAPPPGGDDAAWATAAVPAALLAPLRRHLGRQHPALAGRAFAATRLCPYADTPTGDWIVDFCPPARAGGGEGGGGPGGGPRGSLFLATGGSGHAFKFLPVLGACVAARIAAGPRQAKADEPTAGVDVDSATLAALWQLWRWRDLVAGKAWSTEDGSRGSAGGHLYVGDDGNLDVDERLG
jgi:sarcosine oxidase/L-pipecolate oxidase